jgi:hypothetical protein
VTVHRHEEAVLTAPQSEALTLLAGSYDGSNGAVEIEVWTDRCEMGVSVREDGFTMIGWFDEDGRMMGDWR